MGIGRVEGKEICLRCDWGVRGGGGLGVKRKWVKGLGIRYDSQICTDSNPRRNKKKEEGSDQAICSIAGGGERGGGGTW